LFTKQQKDIWANDILKLMFLETKIKKLESLYSHCDSLVLGLNQQIDLKDKQIEINKTKNDLYNLNETVYKTRIEQHELQTVQLTKSLKQQTKQKKFFKITTIIAPLLTTILFLTL
jgi:hypothetical protein